MKPLGFPVKYLIWWSTFCGKPLYMYLFKSILVRISMLKTVGQVNEPSGASSTSGVELDGNGSDDESGGGVVRVDQQEVIPDLWIIDLDSSDEEDGDDGDEDGGEDEGVEVLLWNRREPDLVGLLYQGGGGQCYINCLSTE